jgi:DNA repair photolyase
MDTLIQLGLAPPAGGIAGMAAAAPTLAAKAAVEYRDLESRSVLNRCDSPRMPFSWTINPYRGCEFGCQYCYARYTHEYMEFDAQAFEQKIFVKQGAGAILRRELARGKGRTEHHAHGQQEYGRGGIAIGTATDPYQPAERRYGVTREILEVLAEARGLDISITTKSDLVTRDISVLQSIAAHNWLHVNMTIVTLHEGLARALEPRAPRPQLRLDALSRLRQAGIEAGVFVMPVLPAITDAPADLDDLFAAAADSGARFIATNVLFLRPCSEKVFYPFLERHFPMLAERYHRRYDNGGHAGPEYTKRLTALVERLRKKHGLAGRPGAYAAEAFAEGSQVEQLSLFN